MIRHWGDLDARARGLSSRLLDRAALLTLAGAAGLPSLRAALPAGLRPAEGADGPTPIDLERAARAHRPTSALRWEQVPQQGKGRRSEHGRRQPVQRAHGKQLLRAPCRGIEADRAGGGN